MAVRYHHQIVSMRAELMWTLWNGGRLASRGAHLSQLYEWALGQWGQGTLPLQVTAEDCAGSVACIIIYWREEGSRTLIQSADAFYKDTSETNGLGFYLRPIMKSTSRKLMAHDISMTGPRSRARAFPLFRKNFGGSSTALVNTWYREEMKISDSSTRNGFC